MMKIHGCKKCGGSLVLDKDEFGWYEQCIQCGYTRDITLDKTLKKHYMAEHMPANVNADTNTQNMVDMWKQDKIPAFEPLKITKNLEEDAY